MLTITSKYCKNATAAIHLLEASNLVQSVPMRSPKWLFLAQICRRPPSIESRLTGHNPDKLP